MSELRWVLLLIGVVVMIAVYVAGRFGREQWSHGRDGAGSSAAQFEPGPDREKNSSLRTDPPWFADPVSVPVMAQNPGTLPSIPDDGLEMVAEIAGPLAEDEIVISRNEAALPAELEIDTQSTPAFEPVQTSPEQGIEPLVLVFMVMAEEGETFSGPDIRKALEAEGLAHGDMRIFHFRQAAGQETVFSVTSVVEPGYLEPAKLAQSGPTQLQTPGLLLFCQLPGPLPGDEALELMLDKAHGLAVRLHGRLCDDRRNLLTAQTTADYCDRIASFKREMMQI